MQQIELDCIFSNIFSQLQELKSKRLNQIHMQDFNIDIIRKIQQSAENTTSNSAKVSFSENSHTSDEKLVFGEKTLLSKWKLRRRSKKIFKLQRKIEKGYISAVDDSIKIVEKVYKKFLEC